MPSLQNSIIKWCLDLHRKTYSYWNKICDYMIFWYDVRLDSIWNSKQLKIINNLCTNYLFIKFEKMSKKATVREKNYKLNWFIEFSYFVNIYFLSLIRVLSLRALNLVNQPKQNQSMNHNFAVHFRCLTSIMTEKWMRMKWNLCSKKLVFLFAIKQLINF